MYEFVLGASAMACATIAFFFVRFWRQTSDRFFFLFALAFAVFATNRFALVLLDDEGDIAAYVVRALTFGLIIIAIVDKNRARSAAPAHAGAEAPPRPSVAPPAGSVPRLVRVESQRHEGSDLRD